ncbi:MAG: tetratricopeptide repeat protein [Myxococcaceae bacterium]|jgi:tetratricopeptide (TPR) repeat protein|nr:tetratricopeptide repeat protein [Myxococcaceae bacterium]
MPSPRFASEFERGTEALKAKDFTAAIHHLEAAASTDATNANGLLRLAQAYEASKQFDLAFKTYLKCSRHAPRPGLPLTKALDMLCRQSRFEEAAGVMRQLVSALPTALPIYVKLARVELGLGQPAKARDTALALVREATRAGHEPLVAEGHLLAGLALLLSSRATEAEKHLLEARQRAPGSAEAWVALAKLRELKKDRIKAEAILREAVARLPRAFAPANELGLLLMRSRSAKRHTEAIRFLEKAALNQPANRDVYLNLALAWYPSNKERAHWCARQAMHSRSQATRAEARRLLEKLQQTARP